MDDQRCCFGGESFIYDQQWQEGQFHRASFQASQKQQASALRTKLPAAADINRLVLLGRIMHALVAVVLYSPS